MSSLHLWGLAVAAASFMRTRSLARRLKTRADVETWQSRRIARYLRSIAPRVAAYRDLDAKRLQDLPLMDKAALMAAFHLYNRPGVTADEARAALAANGHIGKLSVGASTGTSGNRGLYLVSDHERFVWLGVMLAKALPDVMGARHRAAIVLPRNSRLYDAANESGRLALRFFDLHDGIDAALGGIAAFRPTVIVAPPKVLVELAHADLPLAPQRLFSAAEVLDPADRATIEKRFAVTLGQIYMATEGLFAVSCHAGGLHLAEDVVAFEWERPDAESPLVAPIVTDFTRTTQVMARYRMNDLLRLDDTPCACGSPLQRVKEVVGRMDDILRLPRQAGGHPVAVTPDIIRNAIVDAHPAITDFRVIQSGADHVVLHLPSEAQAQAARASLQALFDSLGVAAKLKTEVAPLLPPSDRKLRRVMRIPHEDH